MYFNIIALTQYYLYFPSVDRRTNDNKRRFVEMKLNRNHTKSTSIRPIRKIIVAIITITIIRDCNVLQDIAFIFMITMYLYRFSNIKFVYIIDEFEHMVFILRFYNFIVFEDIFYVSVQSE